MRAFYLTPPRTLKISLWVACSLLLLVGFWRVPLTQAGPLAAPPAQDQVGYWEQITSDQSESWVGDNYRGLSADYEAFFTSAYLIGASYTEYLPRFGGSGDPKEYIVETAYCNWSWPKEQVPQLMRPGEPYTISLSIDASMLGEMILMDVHKAFAAFRSSGQSSGGEFAYAEVFLEKNSEASASGSRTASATFLVPAGAQAGEERILSLNCWPAGGLVQVAQTFTYRWVPQAAPTLAVGEPPAATPAGPAEPVGTPSGTCQPPYTGSLDERYLHLLRTYYDSSKSGIPAGPYSSGSKVNILSFVDDSLKPYTCGGYQQKVLAFLDRIRFNPDPCVRGLLDGLDYGPIQAWYGGHQAVVLYRTGFDWVSGGTVLDPWIEQKPRAYSIADWSAMWSPLGNFRGIGGSALAGFQGRYPTTGGSYENPAGFKLDDAGRRLVESLPKDKQDRFWQLDTTGKLEFLQRAREQLQRGNRAIVHCPLTAYARDDQGRRTGLVDGEPVFEIPEVYFLTYPLSDGTYWTQIEYPLDQRYQIVLEGVGSGPGQLFVTFGVPEESDLPASNARYTFEVSPGQQFDLPAEPGAPLTSGAESLPAQPLDLSIAAELDNLSPLRLPPALQLAGLDTGAEAGAEAGADTGVEGSGPQWKSWAFLACGLCLVAAGLLVAGGLFGYYLLRRRTHRPA